MKRNNKGFTLAELLIVIAIIAILIAIAIPVFAGQLENARLQTDHANIRSAYAMAQVANLEGGLYTGSAGTTWTPAPTGPSATATYYFQADGSIAASGANENPYKLKASVTSAKAKEKCTSSAVCLNAPGTHQAGNSITITYSVTDGYKVVLA